MTIIACMVVQSIVLNLNKIYQIVSQNMLISDEIFILASRSSPLTQLNLALAWNRVDVAESDIFTENSRFQVREFKCT